MNRWMKLMLSATAASCALLAPMAARGVPAFSAVDIGYGIPIDVNAAGAVLGVDSYGGTQPWVLAGANKVPLPLPAGATGAQANRIGVGGAVAGQIGSQAAVWWPTGTGGYAVELLPFPPGATAGNAVKVDASGEVLVSYGTPTRLVTGLTVWSYKPWLYRPGAGLMDPAPAYSSLAVAVDFTDGGRILLESGEIVETSGVVTPAPAFPPRPPGGPGWTFFRAARINEAGAFVGVATLSTSQGYRQVARFTPGSGWQTLGGLGVNVSARGIDAEGNALMMVNYACPSAYGLAYNQMGGSTYCLDDLIVGGGWSFTSLSSGGVLVSSGVPGSGAGAMVALGYNLGARAYRLARLDVAGNLPPPPAVSLTAASHPATWQQPYDSIHLIWTLAGELGKGYIIERRSPGSASFVEIARLGATYAQYDDTAITPLASYSYRIAVIGLGGTGPYSNVATAVAPPAMDRTAPTATITEPAAGTTVSGSVIVSATFADNVGVTYARLTFSPTLGSEVICTRAPSAPAATLTLTCRWDTRSVAYRSPTATITAYAHDAIGNYVERSVNVNVTYRRR